MGGDDSSRIATTLNGIEGYKTAFQGAMGGEATPDNIVQALATFVRTSGRKILRGTSSRRKKLLYRMSRAPALRSSELQSADCATRHPSTRTRASTISESGQDKPMPDIGRGKILADKQDPQAEAMTGAFKTPTLRSVADSGPYFHDGSAKTLDEAVDVLLKGGIDNPHKDAKLKEHKITPEEKGALVAFLKDAVARSGEVRTAETALGVGHCRSGAPPAFGHRSACSRRGVASRISKHPDSTRVLEIKECVTCTTSGAALPGMRRTFSRSAVPLARRLCR